MFSKVNTNGAAKKACLGLWVGIFDLIGGTGMNSKERTLAAINRQHHDRVPIGEFGIDHDHVSKIIGRHTYWRNRKDTTLALWDNRRDEVVDSLKHDCEELVKKLDYDIITVELVPPKSHREDDPPKKIADGVWQNSKGRLFKYAASNDSINEMTHSEGRFCISDNELEVIYKKAAQVDDSCFELIDYIGDKYGNEKAILMRSIDVVGFLEGCFGGDYSHKITLPLLCPDEIKKLYGACVLYNKTIIERCRKHNVIITICAYDFGMNTGCIISPGSIRDVYMPALKMVNHESEKAGMIPFFHCCGNIWDIMDDFVDAGFKGFQSIQESAGMDNKLVKQKYGEALTLWTGIQCETLVSGTMDETAAEVSRNLEILMPGAGLIFGSTNSVQYGAKTDNYLKAIEVVKEKGVYPLP